MPQARVVANGTDSILSLSNFWGTGLGPRVSPLLQQQGYQVTNLNLITAADLWGLFSDSYPYQITIGLETGALPNTVEAITTNVRAALLQATGYEPSAIAVTSAGQTAPTPPSSVIDRTVSGAEGLIGTAATGVQLITIALAIGIVALIYFAASNPKAARKLL